MKCIIDKLKDGDRKALSYSNLLNNLHEVVPEFSVEKALPLVVPTDIVATIRCWLDAGLLDSNDTVRAAYSTYFDGDTYSALSSWIELSQIYEEYGFLGLTTKVQPEVVLAKYCCLLSASELAYLAYRCLFYDNTLSTVYALGTCRSIRDWVARLRKDGMLSTTSGVRAVMGSPVLVLSNGMHIFYMEHRFRLMSTHVLAESDIIDIKERAKASEEWAAFSAYTAALQVCLYDKDFAMFSELNDYVKRLFKSLDITLVVNPMQVIQNSLTKCKEIQHGYRVPSNVPGWDVARFKIEALHVYLTVPVNGEPTTYDFSLESMLKDRDWTVSLFTAQHVREAMDVEKYGFRNSAGVLALFGVIVNNRQQRAVNPSNIMPSLHPECFEVYEY